MRRWLIGALIFALAAACAAPAPTTQAPVGSPPSPTPVAPATATHVGSPAPPSPGVAACDYDPLLSQPARMPPEAAEPPEKPATVTLPSSSPVDEATTRRQLGVFEELVSVVEDNFVYIDLEGFDLPVLEAKYRGLIDAGLSDEDFHEALRSFVVELGDQHSYFLDPQEVIEIQEALEQPPNYKGVGILFDALPAEQAAVVVLTYPDSPAREAGLRTHDLVVAVDGGPVLADNGRILVEKVRGPEGTTVSLTVRTPGEEPRDVTLVRRAISAATPVDFCVFPRTNTAYVMLPELFSPEVSSGLRAALTTLTSAGPLDGLVIDNRMNGGGRSSLLVEVLSLFTDGTLGHFVSRDDRRPLETRADPIGNSLTVPLVILAGYRTESFGEIMSGVLQNSGRAQVVGQTTPGNVEALSGFQLSDGSEVWLAREAFQPVGLDIGVWEETGIVPDVEVHSRWDLFSEADDPALPVALRLLADQGVPIPSP